MFPRAHTQEPHFVDAHVHIKVSEGIAELASAGIMAVRDAGMRDRAADGQGRRNHPGKRPVIISARWALYKKGGYGSLLGVPVESRDEIASEILKLKNSGAGIIKIIASGLVSLAEPGRITAGGFNREELALIVGEAEDAGLAVMAHVNGEQAIIDAAEAGVRSVEHGFFMTTRALDVLAKKNTFWVPTAGALERAADSAHADGEAKAFIHGLIRAHVAMMRHAHSNGVPLAVGTDCVLPHSRYRECYDAELAYLNQAGIPHDEVVRIASEGGARLLGLE